jgi:hypothetical protein
MKKLTHPVTHTLRGIRRIIVDGQSSRMSGIANHVLAEAARSQHSLSKAAGGEAYEAY